MFILDADKFYRESLKSSGVTLPDADAEIAKLAEFNHVSPEVMKYAQAFYEQLLRDEAMTISAGGEPWYTDESVRNQDALKMAEAYLGHVTEALDTVEATVNAMVAKVAQVLEDARPAPTPLLDLSSLSTAKLASIVANQMLHREHLAATPDALKQAEATRQIGAGADELLDLLSGVGQ